MIWKKFSLFLLYNNSTRIYDKFTSFRFYRHWSTQMIACWNICAQSNKIILWSVCLKEKKKDKKKKSKNIKKCKKDTTHVSQNHHPPRESQSFDSRNHPSLSILIHQPLGAIRCRRTSACRWGLILDCPCSHLLFRCC